MSRAADFRAFIDAVGLHGEAAAAASGLTGTDWFVLSLLERRGPQTPSELSALTGLTSGATSRMIDRLERAGRVHRSRGHGDRRKVLVTRSEHAFAHGEIDDLVEPARVAVGAVIDTFTPDEQAVLFRFFAAAAPAFHHATQDIKSRVKPV